MRKCASRLLLAGLPLLTGVVLPALAAEPASPDFAPSRYVGWVATAQEFIVPPSGPGPVAYDPAHRPVPGRFQFRVADLSNPILQPWAREELRKANGRALSGKAAYTPKERCWPIGVPGFVLYPVFPTYFVQTEKQVTMIWSEDHQVRRIHLNVPHTANPNPSWFGESVGRYEGDTLVVDTIGVTTKTFVDNFRTPHTDRLHVVERFRMIDGGKTLEVRVHVEDPGAFTTPWDAIQRYRRVDENGEKNDPRIPTNGMEEAVCAENNSDILNEGIDPIPTAAVPDF